MITLGKQMATGATWMLLFKITERSVGFISIIILARLLTPADFGLVAMANALVAVFEVMSAFGFDTALIQKRDPDRAYFDSAWTLNAILALFSGALLTLMAHPASSFYRDVRLSTIIYYLALGTWVQGFENIGVVCFRKDLNFRKEFIFLLSKRVLGSSVTISLALIYKNYWALVAGILVGRLTGLALSYLIHPYRPRFSLSRSKELFHFSKWLLLNNILTFVNSRASDFILGRLGGPRAVGLYNISYETAYLPTSECVAPINRALFPGYAKMAHDINHLRKGFLKIISVIALVTFPAGVGISLVAGYLVPLLLGPQWLQTTHLIQIIAYAGILSSIQSTITYIYVALGRPRLVTVVATIYTAMLLPSLLFGSMLAGPLGAAIALLCSMLLILPLVFWLACRILHISYSQIISAFLRPGLGCAVMAATLIAYQANWEPEIRTSSYLMHLVLNAIIGASVYLGTILIMWRFSSKPDIAQSYLQSEIRNLYNSILRRPKSAAICANDEFL